MTMSKGDFSPATLTMRPSLIRPPGKIQQLIVGAIGNPDVAVRGDADAHQAEEFFLEREIAFPGDGLAVEIHHEDLPVEAADPDPVFRHGRAPADAVNAHAGEAGDRRRERGSVGAELAHAATDALVDAGLRAGHPVHAAPEIAFRIEHEPAIGIDAAAREAQRESEVVRDVGEIRHEGRTAPRTVLAAADRLRRTTRRVPSGRPTASRAMPAIASRVFFGVAPPGGVAALRKRARQSSSATVEKAVMSEPSVSKLASVVVIELLSGSRSTLPHPPVTGSTRFGTFPAAIRSPSGLPEIDFAR